MRRIIKNINVLDLTTVTEQTLESVGKIKDVNVLLYSRATSGLLTKISMEDVNIQTEVPENSVLSQVNGRYQLEQSASSDKPLFILVNGELLIRPETTVEHLLKGIAGILVNGIIYCPESLKGAVQQKIVNLSGSFITYMADANLISNSVRLDNAFLHTLQPGSKISFGGKVVMIDEVDASLLDEKLEKIEFLNKLIVREDLFAAVSSKVVNVVKGTINTVPGGTYYIDGDLTLDAGALSRIKHKRIHTSGVLRFDNDVTRETLAKVDNLHSESMIICREDLKDVVLEKTSDPTVEVLVYTGKLRIIDGEYKLSAAELKYAKEPVAYIVQGVMNIGTDINPDLFFNSLDFIVNNGIISGSSEHCAIVQLKMQKNSGVVDVTDHEEDNAEAQPLIDDDQLYIRNANYLKL